MKIIGHRGASGTYPENTMPAFREAWTAGADGIELDVQVTSDGRFAVFHDDDGCRLTGIAHKLSKCTWAECSEWDVGVWKGEPFRGTRIPLLTDVLKEAPSGSVVIIELKCSDETIIADLARMIGEYTRPNVIMVTFDAAVADACVKETGRPVYLNVKPKSVDDVDSLVILAVKNGYAGLSMKWSSLINEKTIQSIRNAGLMTAVWTVNSFTHAKRAKDSGVDILMTDWPKKMISLGDHE